MLWSLRADLLHREERISDFGFRVVRKKELGLAHPGLSEGLNGAIVFKLIVVLLEEETQLIRILGQFEVVGEVFEEEVDGLAAFVFINREESLECAVIFVFHKDR